MCFQSYFDILTIFVEKSEKLIFTQTLFVCSPQQQQQIEYIHGVDYNKIAISKNFSLSLSDLSNLELWQNILIIN